MTQRVPTRVPLGQMVTWGSGYGLGTVVGCYKYGGGSENDRVLEGQDIAYDMGQDPETADDSFVGYMIMRSMTDGRESTIMGDGLFVFRSFDDLNLGFSTFMFSKRDVREV